MNVSPGLAVIFTTIRSLSTVVPPVTAHRSPPASRITGADSPVIADSSTVATPSTMSPSPGMISPASTTTRSPSVSKAPETCSSAPEASSRRAMVSVRVLRSVSAWALPRPSAMASARLAKTMVSQSQAATEIAKTLGEMIEMTVVSTEPTQTTNITGLRNTCRGSSLTSACGSDCHAVTNSDGCAGRGCVLMTVPPRSNRVPGTGSTSTQQRR
jgi:hypothetical protein